MRNRREGGNGDGGELRCSGCNRDLSSVKESVVEISEWKGEKKVLCNRCLDIWLRG